MQQSDRTVYVGNVGKEVDESALLVLFGNCGTVRLISYCSPSPGNFPMHVHLSVTVCNFVYRR